MVLSQRERIIGFTTAGVLALFALDHFAFSPLLERRREVVGAAQVAEVNLNRSEQLAKDAPRLSARWDNMLASGLKSKSTEAESQAIREMIEWARDAGLKITALHPDRPRPVDKQKEFQHITLRASGSGTMRSVSQFLWRAQTASIPVRVTDLQINANKDGADDLMMNATFSTLTMLPAPPPGPANARGAQR